MRKLPKQFKRLPSLWVIAAVVSVFVLIGAYISLQAWYHHNLSSVSSSPKVIYFTVEKGDTVNKIATNLKQSSLIRSTFSFESYVRTNELFDSLQAGTYSLSPSMNVSDIVGKIAKGDVTKNLVTILPGKRIDQIKQAFVQAGYSQAQIDTAFNPKTYGGLPALASLPAGATLEGYLYPDSFQKDSSTTATDIVTESLNEMNQKITPDVIQGFQNQKLNVFQGITLASIVYRESDDASVEPTIAQVFLSRLAQGMMLGSDVTAFYGADIAGVAPSVNYDSAFNTRLHTGLPPGPISNFNQAALKAVASPSNTNFLYFVAGDDHKIHFTQTAAEHQAAVDKYCTQQCAQ